MSLLVAMMYINAMDERLVTEIGTGHTRNVGEAEGKTTRMTRRSSDKP